MKIRANKLKGNRIYKCVKFKHGNFGKIKRPFWIEPVESDLWFDSNKLEWIKSPNKLSGLTTTYYSMIYYGLKDVYSLKAVKRLIYKWKAPKGTTFKASLPFVGHDFFLTKNN